MNYGFEKSKHMNNENIFIISDTNFLLNDNLVYFKPKIFIKFFFSNYSLQGVEILTHSFFRHVIWWDSYLNKFDFNFLLNVDFDYLVYSHQGRGITIFKSQHWLTDFLLCALQIQVFAYIWTSASLTISHKATLLHQVLWGSKSDCTTPQIYHLW